MNELFKAHAQQIKLETDRQLRADAGKYLNIAQDKTADDLVHVVEKIAFYSGGIISLSVTFSGFLLGRLSSLLSETFLCVPLKFYLIGSWILLLFAFVSGAFVRWFAAKTLLWGAAANYFDKHRLVAETELKYVESGYPMIDVQGRESSELKTVVSDSAKKYKENTGTYKSKENASLIIKKFLTFMCFSSFILGVTTLTLFAAIVVLRTS